MYATLRSDNVWLSRLGLAIGLLVVAGLAGCDGAADASQEGKPSTSSPVTSSANEPAAPPSLLSVPEWDPADEGEHVRLESGTYLVPRSAWSVADFSVTLPEGWTVQYGHAFARHHDQPEEFGFYGVVVDKIFSDACAGEGGATTPVKPGVDALVTALVDQAGGAVKTTPVSTSLGGYPATRVDLRIPRRLDLERCQMAEYGFSGLQVWYSEAADKYFVLLPGDVARIYVVDVHGERQVFLAQVADPGADADRAELDGVLDSIRIDG
jgi:hypothetical protein